MQFEYNEDRAQLQAYKEYKRALMHIKGKYNGDCGHLNSYKGQKEL